MPPSAKLLWACGAIAHTILWLGLVNRIHALAMHRRLIDGLTGLCGIMLLAIPCIIAAVLIGVFPALPAHFVRILVWCYVALCAGLCIVAVLQRLWWYRHPERRGALMANHTSVVSHTRPERQLIAPGIPTWLGRLPFNEVLKICVQEKQIAIPRLLESPYPLRIVHLSDLHMSGRIERAYFEQVVEEVNAREPDLVAITGDIVEREGCVDWVSATLGQLRAKGRVCYVLGNHDLHVNVTRLHAALTDAGLVHLGGECRQLTVRGTPLLLAGNELPWFEPAGDLSRCPAHDSTGLPLRIVLAHSPDQFGWAQTNGVDLMLAGHLHGGQVRLPILGPILAPSLYGVRYSAGVFMAGKTVMHVSRGTGSLTPLRYNCPPEIAVLTLCAARTK
jgi:predicted MPP superfamily phosphohydrolase